MELTHGNDIKRPYVCKTCSKSYIRESHLQQHSRTHLPYEERPFVCKIVDSCGKRFWTEQKLKIHVQFVHERERPFEVCVIHQMCWGAILVLYSCLLIYQLCSAQLKDARSPLLSINSFVLISPRLIAHQARNASGVNTKAV